MTTRLHDLPMLRMETLGALTLAIEHYLKLKRATRETSPATLVELNLVADAYQDELRRRIQELNLVADAYRDQDSTLNP